MNSPEDRDIEPFDWFNRFFGGSSNRRNGRWGGGFFGFPDIFTRGFEDAFKNMQVKAPKDLVKEYQTP
jgi:HSP20 family protein